MEENTENTEVQGQRVTRARTRRMSLLDTDSRPGTPQLDTASDRGTASPRPTRRTRLNSVTLDVRTPTRPTRASLARGETPEPTTPSSNVKRTARTPAKTKSVRQQLTLKEEEAEEVEVVQVEKPVSRTNTPTPTGEKRVTRSMSQTPPSVTRPSSQSDLIAFPEDKPKPELESAKKPQVVEKEGKAPPVSTKTNTPKVSVRLEKLKMDEPARNVINLAEEMKEKSGASPVTPRDVIDLAEEINEKRGASPVNPKEGIVLAEEIKEKRGESPAEPMVVEILNDDNKQSVPTLDSERSQTVPSINNEMKESIPIAEPVTVVDSPEPVKSTGEKQPASHLLIQLPENNDSLEEQEFLDAEESLPVDVLEQNELVSKIEEDSKVEQQALPQSDIAEPEEDLVLEESPQHKEKTIETPKKQLIASPEKETKPSEIPMDIDEEIEVPDKEDSVIISSPNRDFVDIDSRGEQKKVVGFFNDTKESDEEKKRFPKTPGREKAPSSINLTPKPLKTDVEPRRNSSTPLLKGQESQLGFDKMELQPPPLQIDAIKPYGELEKEKEFSLVQPANVSPKKAVNEILALLNSDEEPEEVEDEEEEGDECEFIANEAEEAPAHYQSGDSMDSSERREIEENEIPCDGESVGSQDTEEESADDSNESNDSFVVPDDDVEEDLDPLCYSTNEEEEEEVEFVESKDKKKRRRILVAESSDDENQEKEQNKSKLSKPKDQSNCSSNASKLSEAAQMMNGSAEKFSNSETELENSRIMALNELNKSERFNKTATRQDASVLELESTDQEEEEEKGQAAKRNESVFEIMDSDEDKSPIDEDEELEAGEGATKDEEPENEEPEEEEPEEEEPQDEEPEEEEPEEEPEDEKPKEEETVEKSTSIQTQKSSKSADEEALAELASSDLRHLETMFNPLQKSRRQSLIMPSHELAAKEPKLKRRSDRAVVGGDFCPSQSFVEMITEQKRLKNKRKRLSKSFTCAAEDLEEMEGIHHERKRLKSSKEDSTESLEDDDDPNAETAPVEDSAEKEASGPDSLQESDSEVEPMQTETIPQATTDEELKKIARRVCVKILPAKETSLDNSHAKEEGKPTREAAEEKVANEKLEPSSEPKTAEYYLEYCNNVLQKANEALRKKKKEDVAAGKRQKKLKRPAASAAGKAEQDTPASTLQTGKQTSIPAVTTSTFQAGKQVFKPPPPPPKKDLKRLQAARQAVGHAVSLLAPTKAADKEPRSLARKLSPQPPQKDKKEKEKFKKTKKQKPTETSPLKSSDEENHVVKGNRFRTNAGFVTVSMIDSPPRAPIIELIKTSSGIMRVEPVTPKQKYFRELPATPKNHGFQERPSSSGHSKKRAKQKALPANSAMQSAMRFKEQAFARKF